MKKRFKMGRRHNKRNFRKGARGIHKKNVLGGSMRGGIRL